MLGTYVVSIHRAISRHEQSWWILCKNLTQSSFPVRLAKGSILFLDQEEACALVIPWISVLERHGGDLDWSGNNEGRRKMLGGANI